MSDLFDARGYADLFERLVRERAQVGQDSRLTAWLKERALERGALEDALAFAETLFWGHPNLGGYQEVRGLYGRIGQWDGWRKAFLSRLAENEQHHLLVEIYLDEGQIERALETLERLRTSRWGWGGGSLAIQVAQAAEKGHPREALRIYVEQAEGRIAIRGRDNYATAASYLVRVRDLYHRLGESRAWKIYIAELRDRNRRLRALKDELSKAGL
jgi:uncharacterized Zn finger protein